MTVRLLQWLRESGISDFCAEVQSRDAYCSHPQHSIDTLDDLKKAMVAVDIPMKSCALNMVFGVGNPHANILLLGEAPGAEEDRQGIPFVGQSGQLLDKILNAVNLDRSSIYITNILPWRPPGNRTPTSDEVLLFRPYVLRHIQLIAPKVVVCLGGTAAKALLQTAEGIMRLRGKWQSVPGINAKILATFHPAYLLRSPGQKREAWFDFLTVIKVIKEEGL